LDMWVPQKRGGPGEPRRFQEALVYSDAPEAVTKFQELAQVRFQLSQRTFGDLEKKRGGLSEEDG